ncbi:hypothetical protein BGZ61DRAFT_361159 [Ilyonectria robusta]|uniref:uncharacterized protein n=1 Tax=Ilyonectria robusta TaxID=1079257 RepID=UPI001E8EF044|nr:uncharacterized protein BGZ61DRAFT_361159 [Ilyonectria robusta]KAH8675201.1 hypothetical protein BGZ61DRAFT_361159 [Ilyonectria robusta]
MEPLDQSLNSEHLSLETKIFIIKVFCGQKPAGALNPTLLDDDKLSDAFLEPYFRYYFQQCDLIASHDNGKYSSLNTHRDVAQVGLVLRDAQDRKDALQRLPKLLESGTKDQHENTICLVARLLLMVRIGEVPHEFLGGRHIEWNEGSLKDFIHGYFSTPSVLNHEKVKFEKSFNALSVQLVAGLEIRWTDNMADHLRLVNFDSVVCVFHHAAFLQHHIDNTMFPPDFIQETLRTIALLFPEYDKEMRKWYRTQVAKHELDATAMNSGQLIADERQLESFKYWHDRLVVLKQVYDESRPNSISQWWHDRRNGVQWYTFWVAIIVLALTIFFGLVQSIEGALQVYKAFNSN